MSSSRNSPRISYTIFHHSFFLKRTPEYSFHTVQYVPVTTSMFKRYLRAEHPHSVGGVPDDAILIREITRAVADDSKISESVITPGKKYEIIIQFPPLSCPVDGQSLRLLQSRYLAAATSVRGLLHVITEKMFDLFCSRQKDRSIGHMLDIVDKYLKYPNDGSDRWMLYHRIYQSLPPVAWPQLRMLNRWTNRVLHRPDIACGLDNRYFVLIPAHPIIRDCEALRKICKDFLGVEVNVETL